MSQWHVSTRTYAIAVAIQQGFATGEIGFREVKFGAERFTALRQTLSQRGGYALGSQHDDEDDNQQQ